MKKIALLPLSSMLVVTPIVASCSSIAYNFKYNFENQKVDVVTKTIESIPEGDVTNFYFQQIYANHQILADDFAKGVAGLTPPDSKGNLEIELRENPNKSKHLFSISFLCSYIDNETSTTTSVTYTNMPISVVEDEEKYNINCAFEPGVDDWKSVIQSNDVHVSVTKTDEIGPIKETQTITLGSSEMDLDDEYIDEWSECISFLGFQSWYLSGE